jgi:thiol-disulfide isomerase/thioredoxin
MDRLHAVTIIGLVALAGCDDEKATSQEPVTKSRVNAVQAVKKQPKADAPEVFCDTYHEAAEAPDFTFPPLDGDAPAAASGWRWVNVWATWCKPCIEEMPLMTKWKGELADDGLGGLLLISADDTQKAVDDFRSEHPETPDTLRVQTPDDLKEWFVSVGLDEGAPLPVHLFVDPQNKVRCLRAGGVGESDFASIEAMIGS